MAVTKLSVSVEAEVAESVKQAARDEGLTVSAWLSAAAKARIRNRLLGAAIADAAADLHSFDDETIQQLITAARSRAIFTGN